MFVLFSSLCLLPAAADDARIVLIQPYPGPHSASNLVRSRGQKRAVILIPGLDLRDDGSSPAGPRFQSWQGSTSYLVKALARHADVFSICYCQTTPVEEVAGFAGLQNTVAQVKGLGYDQVVLLGHSAGGLVARQFAEDHPEAGVTRVIQVATPNGGTRLAGWGVKMALVPREQRPFVKSLSIEHRQAVLQNRRHKRVGKKIEFVSVIATTTFQTRGDSRVNCRSQWPRDLQLQGIPCVMVQAKHVEVMEHDRCLEVLCSLVTRLQPRWNRAMVFKMRQQIEPTPR